MKPKFLLTFLHKPIMTGLRSITSKLLLILALSPALCALSQIPQGFNYQAVARDPSTGFSITGSPMKVQLTIQTDSFPSPGTILWQETHNVTTNSFGLINVIIGKGTRVSGAASFSLVDWTEWPKYFIRTEIEYPLGLPPYKLMGVSRLWSVPYAMIAGDFDGPVKKLAVKGETASLEEPLFEVKNKDGQTVFAVYNEGVRVYVSNGDKGLKGGFAVGGFGTDKAGESTKYLFVGKDSVRVYLDTNPLTKKLKGGFAVGGYDLTKGTVQDYLDVNSDSVRIYIDSDPATKKLKGGFAVGGYDMTKGARLQYLRVNQDSTRIITADTIKGFGVSNLSSGNTLGYLRLTPSNYFIGHQAGKSITTGLFNSVIGYKSGYSVKTGKSNSFIGYKAGYTTSSGNYNVFIGNEAGFSNNGSMNTFVGYISGRNNTSGYYNSFYGDSTGYSNTTGNNNTFLGGRAGYKNTTGSFNICIGSQAGYNNLTGNNNNFIGTYAGYNTTGSSNIMIGYGSGRSNTTGSQNIMIGDWAGYNSKGNTNLMLGYSAGFNTTGISNIMIGIASGLYNTTGNYNVMIGNSAGYQNTTGTDNVMMGIIAGYSNTTGNVNVMIGNGSGHDNKIGSGNTLIGDKAGYEVTGSNNVMVGNQAGYNNIGSNNVFIGVAAGYLEATGSNKLYINNTVTNPPLIYGDFSTGTVALGTITPSTSYKLYINGSAYATGTWSSSDMRWKKNITPFSSVINHLIQLQGVMFDWRKDEYPSINFDTGKQIGLIAQDVEKIFPELVKTDEKGYKAVAYEKLSVVLLEGMKEQQNQIETYKSENDNLKSQLQTLQEKVDKIEDLLAKALDE